MYTSLTSTMLAGLPAGAVFLNQYKREREASTAMTLRVDGGNAKKLLGKVPGFGTSVRACRRSCDSRSNTASCLACALFLGAKLPTSTGVLVLTASKSAYSNCANWKLG